MLKNISIRHLIPLLLFGGGLLLVIFFYTVSYPAARQQALELSQKQTHIILQSQQGLISELLTADNKLPIDMQLFYASTDPATRKILILDDTHTIRHANRTRLINVPIAETSLGIDETLLNSKVAQENIITVPSIKDEGLLIGYAPLKYQNNGRQTTGHLIVIRDYKTFSDSIITIAAYPSELLATFLLLISIFAIAFLRRHIEMRISPVLQAAARLARNEKNVRTHLTGRDEFAEIAASFDQMAARIDASKIELEQAKEIAEKANDAKNYFLSHMSHEIQTPLTTIIGFLDLLKETKLDSDASLYIHSMETSARTLTHLVNDLLETNRLEAGVITAQLKPFCLNNIIQEILDSQLPRAQDKGLSLKVTTSEGNPIWINSDVRIFRQILVNLIGNALQYTNEGTVNIIIESHPTSSNETNLLISVIDTGVGISDKDRPFIFERFYRSATPFVRDQKGAGIGLSICKDFAELIDGKITVDTQLGVGSAFTFAIKVHTALPEIDFDFADLSMREQESLHILLVENAPVMQVLFRSILEKSGHTVDVCDDSETAIQYAKNRLIYPHMKNVSLIIMDLHLPKTDGFQTTTEIRGLGAYFTNIPILATSTQDDQATRNRCLGGSFDGFITKPINRQYLIEEIFRVTHLSEAQKFQI